MGRFTDRITSRIASALRMGAGARVVDLGPRPAQPLTLYEFESCPFCRRVREALTELDLVAHILPCPKGGQRYRPELIERGGKELFPYLVDPNAGVEMYESRFIVRHLYERYGAGSPPFKGGALEIASGSAASAMRLPGAGVRARSSTRPEQPLVLYGYEACPDCRLVREELCSLEIPYTLHSVGEGSPSRPAFEALSQTSEVPWLFDPNTGRGSVGAEQALGYLRETWAA